MKKRFGLFEESDLDRMSRRILRSIWGNLALAGKRDYFSDLVQQAENDSFVGAIERWSCCEENGLEQDSLHVRFPDGTLYAVSENEISKAVEKIHGLLRGKEVHISGRIDHASRRVSLMKIKALGAWKNVGSKRRIRMAAEGALT